MYCILDSDNQIINAWVGDGAVLADGQRLVPITYSTPAYDPLTQLLGDSALTVAEDFGSVNSAPTVLDMSVERLASDLSDRRNMIVDAVDVIKLARLTVGAPVTVSDVVRFADVSDGSRADMTAMATTAIGVLAGTGIPWPADYQTGWILKDNTRAPLPTPADGLTLGASVGGWYASIVQYARTLKDTVLTSDNPESIDITTGWPS